MVRALIVPGEEVPTEGPGIHDGAEALGELRLVFQELEAVIGERVVMGGMETTVRLGDAEAGEQAVGGVGLLRPGSVR